MNNLSYGVRSQGSRNTDRGWVNTYGYYIIIDKTTLVSTKEYDYSHQAQKAAKRLINKINIT